MAYTKEQIDQLKEAIASGELVVQYKDRRIRYRSIAEMKEALAMMEAGDSAFRRRRHRAIFHKGL